MVDIEKFKAEQRERDVERMREQLKENGLTHTRENAERHVDEIYADAPRHRRWNWQGMPESTPAQRVYKGLIALQLTYQEDDDEAAHDVLCDNVLDPFHKIYGAELS